MVVHLVTMTGDQIGEIKREFIAEHHAYKHLPEYCISQHNKLRPTEDHLQFVMNGEEEYLLLDILYTEYPLSEEIDNIGYDDIDFSIVKGIPNIIKHNPIKPPITDVLIFNIEYDITSTDWESSHNEWECVDKTIVGYLDRNTKLIIDLPQSK